MAGLTAIVTATSLSNGYGILPSALAGIGVGLAVGVVNAILVTRFGVNGVITTLGVSTLIAGVVTQLTGGAAVATNIPDAVVEFGLGTFLNIPKIAIALAVVVALAWYVLELTPLGPLPVRHRFNLEAARLVDIASPP